MAFVDLQLSNQELLGVVWWTCWWKWLRWLLVLFWISFLIKKTKKIPKKV